MYFFCENCGNKLESDARFCENCGSAVSYNDVCSDFEKANSFDLTFFTSKNWKDSWKKCISDYNNLNTGIILINTIGCSGDYLDYFKSKLQKYIDFSRSHGTIYFPIDLATQKVVPGVNAHDLKSVLDLLKCIYDCASPDYLMIVGDRNSVPSAKWENVLHDSDEFVDSDLCYFTLDMTSPFAKVPSKFFACPARIPASAKTGFSQACDYFDNVMNCEDSFSNVRTVALSEKSWRNVSELNFAGACAKVYSCPPNSFFRTDNVNTIDVGEKYNLFCFNLHGSQTFDYWVSENSTPGYSPECLPKGYNKYVICTEACYGAKPIIRNTGTQSILVTALQNGCISFCGSTQIAYGTIDKSLCSGANPCAADVLIGSFAGSVYAGDTSGQAYLNAVTALIVNDEFLMEEDIKAIASFALYGDPSLCLTNSGTNESGRKNAKSARNSLPISKKNGYGFISFPNVRLAVNRRIPDVSTSIKNAISMCVATIFSDFSDVAPEYYEIGEMHQYKAAFKKQVNGRSDCLSIYVDKHGSVSKIYVSK